MRSHLLYISAIFSAANAWERDIFFCDEITTYPPTRGTWYPTPTATMPGPTTEWDRPGENEGSIVLRGGAGPHEGNVYMMLQGRPTPIQTTDEWSDHAGDVYNWGCSEAAVVCRQLGYNGAHFFTLFSDFGMFSTDYGMTNTACGGFEEKLVDCTYDLQFFGGYALASAAGVSCIQESTTYPPTPSYPPTTLYPPTTSYPPTTTSLMPSDPCPPGWLNDVTGCILPTNITTRSWLEAGLVCEDMGGFLLEPDSEDLFVLVSSLLKMTEDYYGQQNWWIGLTDSGHEGDWRWQHSGENTNFTSWAPSAPNTEELNHDDCVILRHDQNYKWEDNFCVIEDDEVSVGVICQI